MPTPLQAQFWMTREKKIQYSTIQFINNQFGTISLVANQFTPKTFNVDGVMVEFQPVRADIPKQPTQADGTSDARVIFGRIGLQVRQKLREIDPFNPDDRVIRAVIRTYNAGDTLPFQVYDNLYVDEGGVLIDQDNVEVQLTTDNPMVLRANLFYDPDVFTGLKAL